MRALPRLLFVSVALLAACGSDDGASPPDEEGSSITFPADDTPTTTTADGPPLSPPTAARFAIRATDPLILESAGISPDGTLVVGVGPAGDLCRSTIDRPEVVDWCADVDTDALDDARWGPGGQLLGFVEDRPPIVVDADGAVAELSSGAGGLTRSPDGEIAELSSGAAWLAWSPDGTRLIGVDVVMDVEAFEVLRSELVIIDIGNDRLERTGIETVEWPTRLRWLDDDRVVVVGRTDSDGPPRIDLVDLGAGTTILTEEFSDLRTLRLEDHDVDRGLLLFDTAESGLALYDIDTGATTVVPNPSIGDAEVGMGDAELAPGGGALLSFGRYQDADGRFRLVLATVAVDPAVGTVGEWTVLQTWPGEEQITPHDSGDSLRWIEEGLAFAVTDGSRTLIEIELTR